MHINIQQPIKRYVHGKYYVSSFLNYAVFGFGHNQVCFARSDAKLRRWLPRGVHGCTAVIVSGDLNDTSTWNRKTSASSTLAVPKRTLRYYSALNCVSVLRFNWLEGKSHYWNPAWCFHASRALLRIFGPDRLLRQKVTRSSTCSILRSSARTRGELVSRIASLWLLLEEGLANTGELFLRIECVLEGSSEIFGTSILNSVTDLGRNTGQKHDFFSNLYNCIIIQYWNIESSESCMSQRDGRH